MRSHRRCRAPSLLFTLLLLPACASSRAAVPLTELQPGAVVRVETDRPPLHEGRLQLASPDSIRIALGSGELTIGRDHVSAMTVRRSQWQRGALIGAGLGGVPAAAAFGVLCVISRSDNGVVGDEGEWADCAAIAGLAGAIAGGTIGALIGSASKRWLTVRLTP